MQRHRLWELFEEYDPSVQQVLREVLHLEQQYITARLQTNSGARKELLEKVDEAIEKACNS
ncbi:MAG: hypothetical protein R3C14_10125 [Caldilineaceae bacterium]